LIGVLSLIALGACTASIDRAIPDPAGESAAVQDEYAGYEIDEREVRGTSLTGLIEPGSIVRIVVDYYRTHEPRIGDVVAYNYAGNDVPVIKVVKGKPGDSFHLKQDGSVWRIYINESVVTTSDGTPYAMDARQHRMLSLYERDYGGVVPPEAYLIMGNLPRGTTDSSRFGLVSRQDFVGKVLY
jgi:signal peptidase I